MSKEFQKNLRDKAFLDQPQRASRILRNEYYEKKTNIFVNLVILSKKKSLKLGY